jgi:hypothetical protein
LASSRRVYYAASKRTEIGKALVDQLDLWRKDTHGHAANYRNAFSHYYGEEMGYGITSGVTRGGEQGELANVRVNESRSTLKAYLSIVTGPKLTWRPQARNVDASAVAATTLATSLLEDFWDNRKFSRYSYQWAEQASAFSQAYLFPRWDRAAGPALLAAGDNLVKQGDITIHNVLPWDVVVDNSRKSYDELDSFFVVIYLNRWDLVKLYIRLADGRTGDDAEAAILDAAIDTKMRETTERPTNGDSDVVPVWHWFHKPTPSLPKGREVLFINPDVVLSDTKLTYDEVPLYRLAADEKYDSPQAWTSYWDTLGPQELMDGIETTLATIITTLGGPCVAIENGSEGKPDTIAAGFRVWEYPRNGKPPAAIQLAEFPPDALKYKEGLQAQVRQLMGLNDVAMGQPQTAQMNAQAFAVLASMAVQQAGPFQTAYVDGVARVGAGILKTLARRVSKERLLKITGKGDENLYSEVKWTGKDLGAIDSVQVKIGNPLEQTPAGRLQLLETLKSVSLPGQITPEMVQQVMDTGRIEPATRSWRDEMRLVQAEREQLAKGVQPPVHTVQNHPLHYRENAGVLHNQEALKNPAVVGAVQQHLDAHYLEYFGVPPGPDPMRLARQRFLLGQGPEPVPLPPPGMMGPGGAPGAAPPPGPPMDAGGPPPPAPGAPGDPMAPVGPTAELPGPLPAMPQNPMTGQTFDMTTGGGVSPA